MDFIEHESPMNKYVEVAKESNQQLVKWLEYWELGAGGCRKEKRKLSQKKMKQEDAWRTYFLMRYLQRL